MPIYLPKPAVIVRLPIVARVLNYFLRAKGAEKSQPSAFIPVLIALVLWALVYLTNSLGFSYIVAPVSLFMVLRWAYSSIIRPQEFFSLMRTGGLALLFIQNLSWLLVGYYHLNSDISVQETLLNNDTSLSAYFRAINYTILFSLALVSLGSLPFHRNIERDLLSNIAPEKTVPITVLWVILGVIIVIELVLVGTGVIGFRSLNIEGYAQGKLPPFMFFLDYIKTAQVPLNALLITRSLQRTRRFYKWITYSILSLSLFISLLIAFTDGRRIFAFCIIHHAIWLIVFLRRRPKVILSILAVCLVFPVLFKIMLFANFVRSAEAGVDDWMNAPAVETIPIAYKNFWEFQELEKERTEENLRTRPLTAIPLAKCFSLPEQNTKFAYGVALRNAIFWVIPRKIFPQKRLYPFEENLIDRYFPIGIRDTSDSLYLLAYVDFGFMGILIYPLFLLFIWHALLRLLKHSNARWFTIMTIFAAWVPLFLMSIGEGNTLSWLVAMRNSILIFPALWVLGKFFHICTPEPEGPFKQKGESATLTFLS